VASRTISEDLRHAVYKFAANTSPKAFAEAEKSIKSGHFSLSDVEVDAMLPEALRKKPRT